ncbi:hypothetical protein GCM10027343_43210 [Noviherbaspirillum agri]
MNTGLEGKTSAPSPPDPVSFYILKIAVGTANPVVSLPYLGEEPLFNRPL